MALQLNRSPRLKRAALEYVSTDAAIKDLQARKDAAKKILDEGRGGATELKIGHDVVIRLAAKSRTTVPGATLKSLHPQIHAAIAKTTSYFEWVVAK